MCQTTRSVTAAPQCLPARQTHRNTLPAEIPAAATQRSMVAFTHSGTGTVRMWPPLPTRSTMAQCSSRCCKWVKSRSANSRRWSPQPSSTARIARARFPLSVFEAGACQKRRASSAVSQFPSLTLHFLAPFTRRIGAMRGQVNERVWLAATALAPPLGRKTP